MHTTVSVFVWMALLRREALCVLGALYGYVQSFNETGAAVFSPQCRREVRHMRGSLPLLYADLTRRPWGVVLSQDAAVEPCFSTPGLCFSTPGGTI